jgi:hypothetical protein
MGRPLDPSRNHRITLPDAAEQARRARQGGPYRVGDSGAFNAKDVAELLAQPGCVGLRYYKARNRAGDDSMVLVGVDADGNDMTAGVLLNGPFPCPPYCPDDNDLNS